MRENAAWSVRSPAWPRSARQVLHCGGLNTRTLRYGSSFVLILNLACDAGENSSDPTSGGTTSSGGAAAGASVGGGPATAGTGATGGTTPSGGAPGAGAPSGGTGGSGAPGGATAGGGMTGAGAPSGGTAGTAGGGAPGAGTAGVGGAAPGSLDCGTLANKLFCEDFESYAAGAAVAANGWTPVASSGTLTIDAAHARGKQALHVHTEGNGHAYIQVSPFAPPANSFFGRMHVWVEAYPTAPDYAHFTFVEAAGEGAGVIRPVGGQYIPGKGNLFGTGSDGGPTGDWTNWQETVKAEAGRWVCVEWQLAAADNTINVWLDGQAKPELTVSTTKHGGTAVDFVFPTFDKVWFGWWLYQSGPTPNQFDVWLDDIALTTERVPCPAP